MTREVRLTRELALIEATTRCVVFGGLPGLFRRSPVRPSPHRLAVAERLARPSDRLIGWQAPHRDAAATAAGEPFGSTGRPADAL